jgi:ankyrin repeat protein
VSQDSLNDSFNGLSQTTDKWNPLTFAVYSGNLELIKCIISKTQGNCKRMLKIPGIFKSQEVSRLFPFIMAIRHNNLEMFKFFWEDLAFVYSNEDTFDRLFRLLAKHEKPDLISYLLGS